MRPVGTWPRFLSVLILLSVPSIVVAHRAQKEALPPRQHLSAFPVGIAGLKGQDLPLTQEELKVLGPGEFLLRNYQGSSDQTPINLYIAFFPSQRTGATIHSPKNCLPGSGWTPLESKTILLRGSGGTPVSVERYLIGRGVDRDIVLYWYQAHGRITASEYWARIFLVGDAIRLNRTDGALVRVVAPIEQRSGPAGAEERAADFAETILPLLNSYVPK